MPAISANATASTSSAVEATTSVFVTITKTIEDTVTVTAEPSTVTASFFSTLTLNQTSTVSYNASRPIRTASGFFAASGSGAKVISTASFYSAIPTGAHNSTASTYSHSRAIPTGTGAMESRSSAPVLSTMIVSSELTSPTTTSFRSQVSGAVFGGKSASGNKFISDDVTLPTASAVPTASFYSSSKRIATTTSHSSSAASAKTNLFSVSSSDIAIALTTSSSALHSSSAAALVGASSSSSSVTSSAVASSSSAQVFASSASQVNVAVTSSSSASVAVVTSASSSSSLSMAAIASTTAAAAMISSSSAADSGNGNGNGNGNASASSSSSAHGKASTATSSAALAGSTATYSSNASKFFSSLGSSPASITGTVVVVIAIACVLLAVIYFAFRCYRRRKERHMHLGSDGGSPDPFDEKTARGGPYAFDDDESDIHPEAIWARRLSQLHLSLANAEEAEENPFSDAHSTRERQDSDDWTSFGGDREYSGQDDIRTQRKPSVAQILFQSKRLSLNGTTAPPPPPSMALPKVPTGQFLTVPARPAHPLRHSVVASAMSSPSMYSTRSDEDERRDVLTSLGARLGLPASPDFNPASPVKQQSPVMLGGSPVEPDSVLPPVAPGSWKASLDQVMSTAADFVLSKTNRQSTDLEAQNDHYTAFSSKTYPIRRPQAAYLPSEEDLSPCSTPALGREQRESVLGYLSPLSTTSEVYPGLAMQGNAAKESRAQKLVDASPGIPPVAPLFSSRDSSSSMLALVQAAGLHQVESDESDEAILTASTQASPIARSTARLVTVARRPQPNFASQTMSRSETNASDASNVTASSELTARPTAAGRPSSQATFGRRESYDGAEEMTATEDEEGDDASDSASINTHDSGAEKRRESRVLEVAHQRRASLLIVERRRKSEGNIAVPAPRINRQFSVASLA